MSSLEGTVTLTAALACLVAPLSAHAQTTPPEPASEAWVDPAAPHDLKGGGWHFELAPYFWLAAMDGSVTKDNVTADIDQSLGDVASLLDDYFNGGLALHFEARHDRWGFIADGMYLKLQADGEHPVTHEPITADYDQFLGEIDGFYRVVDTASHPSPTWAPTLDVLAGVRVYSFETTLDPEVNKTVTGKQTWIDPILGLRGQVKPTQWLALFGRGDIGGFGLDDGTFSNFSWNVLAGLEFEFADWFALSIGYRWLDVDYKNTGDNFDYDMLVSGPFTALVFRF